MTPEGPKRFSATMPVELQWRALTKPAFETRNGTTKFSAQRTQVAAVA